MVTEMVLGKSLEEVSQMSKQAVADALGASRNTIRVAAISRSRSCPVGYGGVEFAAGEHGEPPLYAG